MICGLEPDFSEFLLCIFIVGWAGTVQLAAVMRQAQAVAISLSRLKV